MADSKDIAIENYFLFLKNLEDSQKLKLISKLSDSMISDQQENEQRFFSLCGKLDTKESADELIETIHNSRYFDSHKKISL